MTFSVSFTVPGEVRGKGRPRFAKGRTYTDAATAIYENLIKMAAREEMGGRGPLAAPIKLSVHAKIAIPASASGKRQTMMRLGQIEPLRKPDFDNVLKVVADALTGVVYLDDKQVIEASFWKGYDTAPLLYVRVSELLP